MRVPLITIVIQGWHFLVSTFKCVCLAVISYNWNSVQNTQEYQSDASIYAISKSKTEPRITMS
jgi:hypothetical protein